MAIVGGFDLHRRQITFDCMDTETGELKRGRIMPVDRLTLRGWLERFKGLEGDFALEAGTGWRFVVEELTRAGLRAHLADPGETAALRGSKRRAKTDRADARHETQLLLEGRLPEAWIPPAGVLEIRTLGRLYMDLCEERRAWCQRIKAQLFHQGCPAVPGSIGPRTRGVFVDLELTPAGRRSVDTALRMVDALDVEIRQLRRDLARFARRHPGCRGLLSLYGIGPLTAALIWAEMGDTRRFSSSRQAVRHTGIDVTVYSTDGKRVSGYLSRQGPPVLRWALYEAAKCGAKTGSPDHDYYIAVRDRLGSKRATLSLARKIARRAHHVLRALGDGAWVEAA